LASLKAFKETGDLKEQELLILIRNTAYRQQDYYRF